ncbi:hypothetical protein, conserved [Eimeria praecox]|uniref:Uncharacterized protein n=1 Tax=Eimeria praecox TaxID=51316 RepID=U6GZL7_9EIME|nr:hypothetical protein, conserved [Eimeria praecox]
MEAHRGSDTVEHQKSLRHCRLNCPGKYQLHHLKQPVGGHRLGQSLGFPASSPTRGASTAPPPQAAPAPPPGASSAPPPGPPPPGAAAAAPSSGPAAASANEYANAEGAASGGEVATTKPKVLVRLQRDALTRRGTYICDLLKEALEELSREWDPTSSSWGVCCALFDVFKFHKREASALFNAHHGRFPREESIRWFGIMRDGWNMHNTAFDVISAFAAAFNLVSPDKESWPAELDRRALSLVKSQEACWRVEEAMRRHSEEEGDEVLMELSSAIVEVSFWLGEVSGLLSGPASLADDFLSRKLADMVISLGLLYGIQLSVFQVLL